MTQGFKKRILKTIGGLVFIYLLVGVALYFVQDYLLFHPTALPKNHQYAIRQSFIEQNLAQADGTNLALVKFVTQKKRGIVLYFHGNMQNVERYAAFSTLFTQSGYELWMIDYRGFGKSTGKITEEGLYKDALLVYNEAVADVGAENIIIYGKSLGTGIAAQLAATQKSKQLILETPYYSIRHIAKDKFPIYPVQLLVKYNLPTYQYLPRVTVPVTAFHGTADEVISYWQAQRLKEENKGLDLITIEGGKHNNLLSFPRVTNHLTQILAK